MRTKRAQNWGSLQLSPDPLARFIGEGRDGREGQGGSGVEGLGGEGRDGEGRHREGGEGCGVEGRDWGREG